MFTCFTHKRIHSILLLYQPHLQYMQKSECKCYIPYSEASNVPTVKIHLFLRMEKEERMTTQILHNWNEAVHFRSSVGIPAAVSEWTGRCALAVCSRVVPSQPLLSGVDICKPPITLSSVETCLLMWSPKSCAIFIWGDTVTNMAMCKSSDLLNYFWNQTTLK